VVKHSTERSGWFLEDVFTVPSTIMVFQPKSLSPIQVLSACNATSHLDKLVHLFMVSLVPFSTAWAADTKLAAVPEWGGSVAR